MCRVAVFCEDLLLGGTVLVCGLAQPGLLEVPTNAAQKVPRTVETSGLELVTPETQQSIDRGLEYLAQRQHDDGSFGSGRRYQRNVAVTALCGMAFLSAGHTPGRGKYGRGVQKTIKFIVSRTMPNGFIVDDSSKSQGPMYGHGFATLFLAEVYGMSRRKELRPALEKAVRLIVNTQNKEGGWRYNPEPKEADISVTVCQIMSLRAARNCGIYVPKNTIDKCIEYVKRSQNSDGGFAYQLTRQAESLFPRSAAGVVALYSAGIYEGREIERGLSYLNRHLPRGDLFRRVENHYYYGHYYAVQAMWHAGESHWRRWYPAVRDELLLRQRRQGSRATGAWIDTSYSNEYATAMACLILQMPNNYLPIFQR